MARSPFVYGVVAPNLLGLAALAAIVLPGDPGTGRILLGFAVYLIVVVGGSGVGNRLIR
ncbi:hypothetical protein ACFYVK_35295 [Streptomyces chartreusis]|uniref:hypothetical protein n=1 Tax=Streptomyces chartreusis TaxID=1969 RepID=UPI003693303E